VTGIVTVIAAEPRLRLDGIITVVDATSLADRFDEPALAPLLQRQLDAAHIIVLSRSDQLSATELDSLTQRLTALAPGRPVIPVDHGRLDPSAAISAASRGARPEPTPAGPSVAGFATSTLDLPSPIPRGELTARLESLDLLRAKGFVELLDTPGRSHLVQMVGRSWTIDDWGPHSHDHHVGRLVTISLK
jgi:G3E family GTPase